MLIEEKELERMVDEVSFVNSRRYINVNILVQTVPGLEEPDVTENFPDVEQRLSHA